MLIEIERAVPGNHVGVEITVCRETCSRGPESAETAVRGGIPNCYRLQSRSVETHHPSVIGANIAVRSPCDINGTILQEQTGALPFTKSAERNETVHRTITRSLDASCDQDWTAKLLRSGCDVQGMKALGKATILLRLCRQIHGVRCQVDDWSARNADLRNQISATHVTAGYARNSVGRINQTLLPQRRGIQAGIVVGIKRVDAVMLGDYVDDVVRTQSRNVYVGHVKGLSIDLPVHVL